MTTRIENSQTSNLGKAFLTQKELERTACLRKTCLKTMSCVCLPFSLLGHCVMLCNNQCNVKRGHYVDKKGVPFCEHTTCKCTCAGEKIWRPALLPEEHFDMLLLGCDPCVCAGCLQKDDSEHFLLPPERQFMDDTQTASVVSEEKSALEKRISSILKRNTLSGAKCLRLKEVADKITENLVKLLRKKREEEKPHKYIDHLPFLSSEGGTSNGISYIPMP